MPSARRCHGPESCPPRQAGRGNRNRWGAADAGLHDVKRGIGAVGVLTAGLVDRRRAYEVLVAYALAPWLARDWFEGASG